jgi:hypothetical protein
MWQLFKFKLQRYFSSGWSRWFDINYVIVFRPGRVDHYALDLMQVKVNSKSGKRKYRFTNIMYASDKELLHEIAAGMRPKLTIRG